MILILHITIALASLLSSTVALFSPTMDRVRVSLGLVGLTLVSGTYLVVSTQTHLLRACITGLAYVAISFGLLATAHYKLARVSIDK